MEPGTLNLEPIKNTLKELVEHYNLYGIVLAHSEGIPLISYFKESVNQDLLASASAAVFAASSLTANTVKKPSVIRVIVNTPLGDIITYQILNNFIVALIFPSQAKREVLKSIRETLEKALSDLNK